MSQLLAGAYDGINIWRKGRKTRSDWSFKTVKIWERTIYGVALEIRAIPTLELTLRGSPKRGN